MKSSVRYLGGCIFIVEPCETDVSKRVHFMTLLGPAEVLIVFRDISIPLLFSLLSLLSYN